jgi:subtilase family serine protease
MPKSRRNLRPRLERLDDRCLLSGYTPAQLAHAYGLDAIAFRSSAGAIVPGDGSGETIALIEAFHDPTLASDLHVFDQANGLPDPQLTVVDEAGTRTNATWASEETLDVEWAHAIAPGAAILVVEARSPTITSLLSAVDTARNTPGVVAISMSWGFNETALETSYDVHFTTPAGHEGITFVASSGDNGAAAGAEYPAASPDVLAVGGTTLKLDGLKDYVSETGWNGSGSGGSRYEAEPSYQDSVQSTGRRNTPDVVFDGNPKTGVAVYETPLHGGPGTWQTEGGTSLGTPAWAAIIAIADQGRALAGEGSLDGPTQTLPALYRLPATDFHYVSAPPPAPASGGGFNPFGFLSSWGVPFLGRHTSNTRAAGSRTSKGSNLAMGLGSPNGSALITDLVASQITIPMTATANVVKG